MDAYVILLNVGIILLFGFLFGKLVEQFRLPDITGYILAGVIIGPNGLNLISVSALESLGVITNIVLGIIAYQIGTELFIPILKSNAKSVIMITMVHVIVTLTIVFLGFI